ncbi:MAG TPA: UbiA family prenyltransferase [Pyrinomonadaceae bacterium]|nr:UbiA family prenyltransferase [Pyrinomonadaceae bacterium]
MNKYRKEHHGDTEKTEKNAKTFEMTFLLPNAFRVHQWIKNFLVFVPLLMAHRVFDTHAILRTSYAFVAWCLCASAVYLVNDLLDLEADREHPRKKLRPLASGALNSKTLWLLVPLLLLLALGIAFLLLPVRFGVSLILYLGLTTAYSVYLKRILIVDVLLLAALYALRVLSGGFAADIPVSPWLLAFSMFLFLSLAFVKRYAELRNTEDHTLTRRRYSTQDSELLKSFGAASGYLSVLVLVLYINSREVVALYHSPTILWLIGPCLLYWITRMWLLAYRGEMDEDPILFTVKDWPSYMVGIIVALVIVVATLF